MKLFWWRHERQWKNVDIKVGSSEYFLRKGSSGLIVGPRQCKDGLPRHFTIPFGPGGPEDVLNVHMKSGRGRNVREEWRILPEEILPKVTAWVNARAAPLDARSTKRLSEAAYCISIGRVLLSFQLFQQFFTKALLLLARGFCIFRFCEIETDNRARIIAVFDRVQALKVERIFERTLPFVRVAGRALSPAVKQFFRLHLVKLESMSSGDACLVMPKDTTQSALVVIKNENAHVSLPLQDMVQAGMDWYSKLAIEQMKPDVRTDGSEPRLVILEADGFYS